MNQQTPSAEHLRNHRRKVFEHRRALESGECVLDAVYRLRDGYYALGADGTVTGPEKSLKRMLRTTDFHRVVSGTSSITSSMVTFDQLAGVLHADKTYTGDAIKVNGIRYRLAPHPDVLQETGTKVFENVWEESMGSFAAYVYKIGRRYYTYDMNADENAVTGPYNSLSAALQHGYLLSVSSATVHIECAEVDYDDLIELLEVDDTFDGEAITVNGEEWPPSE